MIMSKESNEYWYEVTARASLHAFLSNGSLDPSPLEIDSYRTESAVFSFAFKVVLWIDKNVFVTIRTQP